MAKVMQDLALRLSADVGELKKGLNKANKSITGFKKSVDNLNEKAISGFKQIGASIAAAFAIRSIANFAKEAANLAGQFQGVSAAFKQIKNSDQVLKDLTKATAGTVSEMQLMQEALKAKNFRIPMAVLAQGLEFATKRAAQTGESVDYLVQSFVTGLGRESVLILDNLGISALEIQKEIKRTGDFMVAVGNITRRELESMGEVILTDAQKMQQLRASAQNLKVTFGELVLKGLAPLINAANILASGLNNTKKSLTDEQDEIGILILKISGLNEKSKERAILLKELQTKYPQYFGNIDIEKTKTEDLVTALDEVNKAYQTRINIQSYGKELAKVKRELDRLKDSKDKDIKSLYEWGKRHGIATTDLNDLEEAAKDYIRTQEDYVLANKKINAQMSVFDLALKNAIIGIGSYRDEEVELLMEQKVLQTSQDELNRLLDETVLKYGETTISTEAYTDSIINLGEALRQTQGKAINPPSGGVIEGTPPPGTSAGPTPQQAEAYQKILDKIKEARGVIQSIEFPKDIGNFPEFMEGTTTIEEFTMAALNLKDAFKDFKMDNLLNDIDTLRSGMTEFLNSYGGLLNAKKNAEIKAAESTIRNEKTLAAKRLTIEKEYAKKQQPIAITQAIINGAVATTKAFAQGGVLGFITAGLIAASVGFQLATIKAQSFAEGGVVSGPTLGLIGEYPGAKSNPEIVAPLNKLENLLSTSLQGNVVFRIEGSDLVGVLEKAEINKNAF